MANPQAENGHVDIAHEIIEALARYRINGEAWQCLLVVFRKTYGWKKTEDEISLSQFSQMTGLKRPNVSRAISALVSKKILCVIKEDTTFANKYRFNKDFESWTPVIKKDTGGGIKEDNEVVSKKIRMGVSKKIHTKETSTKETIQMSGKPDIPYGEIIDYLNSKTGQHYLSTSKDSREHIKARWEEGSTLEDFKRCIDNMSAKWMNDPKMAQYLRPATLFAKGKFEGYVNQIVSKKEREGVFL